MTQEKIKEIAYYSNGKLFRISQSGSRGNKDSEIGWITEFGYRRCQIENKQYMVHQLIYLYHYGFFVNEIDHINHNRADNRIENLREVTSLANKQNMSKRIDNVSGFTGVGFVKSKNKWRARIKNKDKEIHLGMFDNLEDAINARKKSKYRIWFS